MKNNPGETVLLPLRREKYIQIKHVILNSKADCSIILFYYVLHALYPKSVMARIRLRSLWDSIPDNRTFLAVICHMDLDNSLYIADSETDNPHLRIFQFHNGVYSILKGIIKQRIGMGRRKKREAASVSNTAELYLILNKISLFLIQDNIQDLISRLDRSIINGYS